MKIQDNDIFGCIKRIRGEEDKYCKNCEIKYTMKRAHITGFVGDFLDDWSAQLHLCAHNGQIVKKTGPHTWINHFGDEIYAS